MDLRILLTLMIFLFFFMGSVILISLGALRKNRKQVYTGLILLGLCILFLFVAKNIGGLY
jgi:hypothetical membrane protein